MENRWKTIIAVTAVLFIFFILIQDYTAKIGCHQNINNKEYFDIPVIKKIPVPVIDRGLDFADDANVEGDIVLESIDTDKRDYIDEGRMEGIAAHSLKCSRACCGTDWPVPKELRQDGNFCGKNYVRTNLNCANGSGGSGCVCMPRQIRKIYEKRGMENNPGFI
jgi:hypothetical protein